MLQTSSWLDDKSRLPYGPPVRPQDCRIEEDDSDIGKILRIAVILKRDIPAIIRKTIVRNTVKRSVLTIVDSHALKNDSS